MATKKQSNNRMDELNEFLHEKFGRIAMTFSMGVLHAGSSKGDKELDVYLLGQSNDDEFHEIRGDMRVELVRTVIQEYAGENVQIVTNFKIADFAPGMN